MPPGTAASLTPVTLPSLSGLAQSSKTRGYEVPEEFSLGLTEVAVAVERAGLPPNWHPFEIRSVGLTLAEHDEVNAAAWDALQQRGLARADKLDLDVEDTLRAWTQPEVLIVVRAVEIEDGRRVFYRATTADGLGVFSEYGADGILFAQERAERLVDTVVGMLPRYGPVPLAEVVTTSGTRPERDLAQDNLVTDPGRPAPSHDRMNKEALSRFSSWPLHRHGTVELSVRAGAGSLHPRGTVQFVDTDGGRFLSFTEQLSGNEVRYRFVPSDGSHLRRWLHETIGDARR
jgi:hypothetical protein